MRFPSINASRKHFREYHEPQTLGPYMRATTGHRAQQEEKPGTEAGWTILHTQMATRT